jgi:hypothetical protein
VSFDIRPRVRALVLLIPPRLVSSGGQPGMSLKRSMSALGRKRTCASHKPMSALPPKADIGRAKVNVLPIAYCERLPILNLAISVVAS